MSEHTEWLLSIFQFFQFDYFIFESYFAPYLRAICYDDSVEIGYLLLPEYHGKGIGTESLLALIKHIQQFFPTVKNINAIVTDGNVASCKVLEKAGFELMEREENAYQIGGKLYDDLIYRFHI